MNINNRAIIILRVTIAALFLLSIYAKLANFFEFQLLLQANLSTQESMAIKIASIIIATELFFLYSSIFDENEIFIKINNVAFLIFNLVIVLQYFTISYDNCYCFMNLLDIPLWLSLIKNSVVLIVLIFINRKIEKPIVGNWLAHSFIKLSIFVIVSINLIDSPYNYFSTAEITKLSFGDVKKIEATKKGKIIYVDARDRYSFLQNSIPGAVNIPLMQTRKDRLKLEVAKYLNNYDIVITFCDSEMCSLSYYLALEIRKIYPRKKIYVLKGGIKDWQNT